MKAVAAMVRTREAYESAFQTARLLEYPEVDAFEQRMGYAIERQKLDNAAAVLACPLKANPPHWQHGRVIYAAARAYLRRTRDVTATLDIGTAKGFSALCLVWALMDSQSATTGVFSLDVVDPDARVSRNTVNELVDGLMTVPETLRPWPETLKVTFLKWTGVEWLSATSERIGMAFIDGKHDAHVVRQEGKLLSLLQERGDLAMFDDCQMPTVSQAVVSLEEFYRFEYLTAGPRSYAVGWRR